MPPRKNPSTKAKINKKSNLSVTKRFLEETIEILDSDDDFVVPNPHLRARYKNRKSNEALNASSFNLINSQQLKKVIQEEKIDNDKAILKPRLRARFQKSNKTTNETESDEFNTSSLNSKPKVIQEENIDEDVSETNCTNNNASTTFELVDVEVEDDEDEKLVTFVEGHYKSKDAWKGLMQRMQQNQSTSTITNDKNNTFSKNSRRNNPKAAKKPVVLLPKGSNTQRAPQIFPLISPSDSIISEDVIQSSLSSPPKKLKLEMIETSDTSATTHNDKSIQSTTLQVNPDAKIPAMFLKPTERALLNQSVKLEKSNIQLSLCEALERLSTEPETFSSVNLNPDHFDGNIVKLNHVQLDSDPYGGTKTKVCPFYKKLPGTRFSVDAFNYGLIPGIEVYFLSHFHSDHYIGLTKKFCKTLICSPPTGNLVKMKVNVDEACIRRLQINRKYIIDGVEVILINANHCPGSVMFIFKLPNGTIYFHTGDFRFTKDMLQNHHLQGLRIDNLYLDTTYCDPKYDFPTQTEAITELITVVKKQVNFRPKTLIVCGSYVIGKERVYFSLAEALQAKIYINAEKRRIINALENPLYAKYLTSSEDIGSIHVMQMFSIVPKFLSEYLSSRTNKYTHIIGVKPSGWQFSSSGDGTSIKNYYNDTVTIIGVPYSEHSSFSELRELVTATKPKKVQPTVNVGNTAKREAMMEHINKWLM